MKKQLKGSSVFKKFERVLDEREKDVINILVSIRFLFLKN